MLQFEPETLTIIGGALAIVGTAIVFIFKGSWWLSDQFKQVTNQVFYQYKVLEDKFEVRHIDNVARFVKLETKLDIALKNGH